MSGGAVILMAQIVGRRTASMKVWHRYNADDLMVIDEAHYAAAAGWERAMKQWPGQIISMTATPWRLSKKEGFDPLFDELLCGPQVADLRAVGWLCDARTLLPPPEQRIIGGEVDRTGDCTIGTLNGPKSGVSLVAGHNDDHVRPADRESAPDGRGASRLGGR